METVMVLFRGLSHWQIDGLVTLLLLQGAVFALVPEELIILSVGVLWSQGRINYLEGLLSVQFGLLPANAALVFIGGKFGKTILRLPALKWLINAKKTDQALGLIRTNASAAIVLTRFTPLIRGPSYIATGMAKVGLFKFMKIDAASSIPQVSLLLMIGFYFGHDMGSLEVAVRQLPLVFLGVLAFAYLATVLYRKTMRVPYLQQ